MCTSLSSLRLPIPAPTLLYALPPGVLRHLSVSATGVFRDDPSRYERDLLSMLEAASCRALVGVHFTEARLGPSERVRAECRARGIRVEVAEVEEVLGRKKSAAVE